MRVFLVVAGVVIGLFVSGELFGADLLTAVIPLVYALMAIGILDAAAHRDSVWHEADQDKLAWILVQLLPLIGTVGYVIVVHPHLKLAERRQIGS